MTIIERIMALCAERGWTLKVLSEEAGLSEGTVYKWKHGKEPTTTTLKKICAAFGMTEFQFFTGCYPSGLNEEQRRLLDVWSMLTGQERNAFLKLMDVFISSRREQGEELPMVRKKYELSSV